MCFACNLCIFFSFIICKQSYDLSLSITMSDLIWMIKHFLNKILCYSKKWNTCSVTHFITKNHTTYIGVKFWHQNRLYKLQKKFVICRVWLNKVFRVRNPVNEIIFRVASWRFFLSGLCWVLNWQVSRNFGFRLRINLNMLK